MISLVGSAATASTQGQLTRPLRQAKRPSMPARVSVPPGVLASPGHRRYSAGNAFVNEAMMTFLLLFVVFEVAVNKKSEMFNVAPVAIGFAVFVAVRHRRPPTHRDPRINALASTCHLVAAAQHLVCLPVTGCSINPTRSFGPALVATINGSTGLWNHMWIFWLGPIFGAVLAAFIRGRPIVRMNQKLFASTAKMKYNQRRAIPEE